MGCMGSIEELTSQAESAFKNARYDEAKQLCREGIKQLEKSEDKASIKATIRFLSMLSDSDDLQGRWFDSVISLERIIELAERGRDLTTKTETMIKIGELFLKSGKWEKAREKSNIKLGL